jgi:type II secretory ATPase GspE/PulE/Tfp pilus assembly ATPase PilB-like protein
MKLTSSNAQDGRFAIIEGGEEISIRTSLVPGAYGEKIVMRILDPKSIQILLKKSVSKIIFSKLSKKK